MTPPRFFSFSNLRSSLHQRSSLKSYKKISKKLSRARSHLDQLTDKQKIQLQRKMSGTFKPIEGSTESAVTNAASAHSAHNEGIAAGKNEGVSEGAKDKVNEQVRITSDAFNLF